MEEGEGGRERERGREMGRKLERGEEEKGTKRKEGVRGKDGRYHQFDHIDVISVSNPQQNRIKQICLCYFPPHKPQCPESISLVPQHNGRRSGGVCVRPDHLPAFKCSKRMERDCRPEARACSAGSAKRRAPWCGRRRKRRQRRILPTLASEKSDLPCQVSPCSCCHFTACGGVPGPVSIQAPRKDHEEHPKDELLHGVALHLVNHQRPAIPWLSPIAYHGFVLFCTSSGSRSHRSHEADLDGELVFCRKKVRKQPKEL